MRPSARGPGPSHLYVCLNECPNLEMLPFKVVSKLPYGILIPMTETIQIDRAGRVVLPKRFRERFRLRAGDTLAIEAKGDAIELRPTKSITRLVKVNGVLVLTGETALPEGLDVVAESREARIEDIVQAAKLRR